MVAHSPKGKSNDAILMNADAICDREIGNTPKPRHYQFSNP